MVVHGAVQGAAFDQLALAPTACAAIIIHTPRRLRAIGAILLPPARQFPADRARRAAKKTPDRPLATASIVLGEYHATFLATEVLASSVHRNILCPTGRGCCTGNLRLSAALHGLISMGLRLNDEVEEVASVPTQQQGPKMILRSSWMG